MSFQIPKLTMPHIPTVSESYFDALKKHVLEAADAVQQDEALLVLYHTKAGESIRVQDIYYSPGLLMTVKGIDPAGQACQVLVNVFDFEVILKVIKMTDRSEKKPIGFHYES